MRMAQLLVCCASVGLVVGCGADSENGMTNVHTTNSGIEMRLTLDHHPKLMETLTFTSAYKVVYPLLPEGRNDYVVTGHFALPVTHFTVISGESSWVDTVMANTHREHSVVAKAIRRGDWLVDAMATSVIIEEISVISGAATVEVHVK